VDSSDITSASIRLRATSGRLPLAPDCGRQSTALAPNRALQSGTYPSGRWRTGAHRALAPTNNRSGNILPRQPWPQTVLTSCFISGRRSRRADRATHPGLPPASVPAVRWAFIGPAGTADPLGALTERLELWCCWSLASHLPARQTTRGSKLAPRRIAVRPGSDRPSCVRVANL